MPPLKVLLPLILTNPARFAVPPLTVNCPAPVMLESPPAVCVPPERISAVPAGTSKLPLCAPPAFRLSAPV